MKFTTLSIVYLFTIEILTTLNANQINLSGDKSNFYMKRLQEDITFFNNYERSSPLLHNLQIKFKCCGLNGPEDYKTSIKPSSCLYDTVNHKKSKGCAEIIKNHNPEYENECERIFDDYEYHRERFYVEMKYFEEEDSLPSWLDRIQTKYQCCGFNGPKDYKHFFKPPSCCDQTSNDTNLLTQCLHPPKDVEGSLGSVPHYYAKGCSYYLESIVNEGKIEKSNENLYKNIFHQFELNRMKFMQALQRYDENGVLSLWLDDIQKQSKCCGYDGPGDYASFIKPATCRVLHRNNVELIQIFNQNDNSDEAVQYYLQGCGRIVNENITRSFNMEINLWEESNVMHLREKSEDVDLLEKRNDGNSLTWIIVGISVSVCIVIILIGIIFFIWKRKPFDESHSKKAKLYVQI